MNLPYSLSARPHLLVRGGLVVVRDDVQLETIKRAGPMAALRAVSGVREEGRTVWPVAP